MSAKQTQYTLDTDAWVWLPKPFRRENRIPQNWSLYSFKKGPSLSSRLVLAKRTPGQRHRMNVPFGLSSGPLRKPWISLDLKGAGVGTGNMTGYLLSSMIVLETLVLPLPLMSLREKLVHVRWRDGSVSKSTYLLSVRTLVKTNGIHTKIWSRPHMYL